MCTISLTLAKPGEAMPGPYSSLMCFAVVRPGAAPDEGPGEENGGQRRHRSDSTFDFKQRRTRHSAARATVRSSGADPSVSRVHAGIVS